MQMQMQQQQHCSTLDFAALQSQLHALQLQQQQQQLQIRANQILLSNPTTYTTTEDLLCKKIKLNNSQAFPCMQPNSNNTNNIQSIFATASSVPVAPFIDQNLNNNAFLSAQAPAQLMQFPLPLMTFQNQMNITAAAAAAAVASPLHTTSASAPSIRNSITLPVYSTLLSQKTSESEPDDQIACGIRKSGTYQTSLLSELMETVNSQNYFDSVSISKNASDSVISFMQSYDPRDFKVILPIKPASTATAISSTAPKHISNSSSSQIPDSINQKGEQEINQEPNQIAVTAAERKELEQLKRPVSLFPCGTATDLTHRLSESMQITVKQNESDPNNLIMKKGLKNLFFLYLNGDCRGIKDCFSLQDDTHFQAAISNRYVSYKYKSKHINFDLNGSKGGSQPKNAHEQQQKQLKIIEKMEDMTVQGQFQEDQEEENVKGEEQGNNNTNSSSKHVIYNKSKYVMQFLLSLLDPNHLSFLTIPEGFERKIAEIQSRIRECSKKNKLSQSQFYNHAHFDCLFLQLHRDNIEALAGKASDVRVLHEKVFDFYYDSSAPAAQLESQLPIFEMHTVNMYKHLLAQIVLTQASIIQNEIIPHLSIHSLSFKSASKLKYFQRICESLVKLNQGFPVAKF